MSDQDPGDECDSSSLGQRAEVRIADCCHRCCGERGIGDDPWRAALMLLCSECGNKRCPKASDHRLNCTASNEPGQAGSVYA